jgi:hypothetical protein
MPKELWEKMHPDRPKIIDCEQTISDFKRRQYEQEERQAENSVRKAVGKRKRQVEGN